MKVRNSLPILFICLGCIGFSQKLSVHTTEENQFDFWIGDWDVYKFGTDTIIGVSSIKLILNHKAIEENYLSTQYDYKGKSLNTFNEKNNQWEQYWVDNSGLRLHLSGGIKSNNMILSDCETANPCNQITWMNLSDGTVRQQWEQSKDKGKTWKKVFDGHYKTKVKNTADVAPALTMLVNYPKVRDFTLSKSGKEAYCTIQSPLEEISVLTLLEIENGTVREPVVLPFSGKYKDLEPFLSPDNKQLYFVSNRPLNQRDDTIKDFDIWYVERRDIYSEWSRPINLGLPINTGYDEFYPSVANNGNLYFTRNSPDAKGEDDIFCSEYIDNNYIEPFSLSTAINTGSYEFNSYIAPDESFIIFSGYNRKDGFGSGDLYISVKNKKDIWQDAVNLGEKINSKFMDYCPFVDSKSGTLYFTSTRSDIQSAEFKTIHNLMEELAKYENGSSRIYKTSIKEIMSDRN